MSGDAQPAQPHKLNRVLITADAVGGVWQYTVDLTKGLVRAGWAVMVATMGPPPSPDQLKQIPASVQVVSGEYALEWQDDPWAEVDAAADWLLILRDQIRPNLVHLNGYVHATLDWGCPVLVVAHSCVVSWWRSVYGCVPGPEWSEYRRRVQNGLLACDHIVTPTGFMAGEIAANYEVASSKISVISNFSSAPVGSRTAKEPFCLAAGRVWDQAKNFALLREVARQSSWPIYLAGGGHEGRLTPLQMLGSLPHEVLRERMERASIFVHPALYEPFGLAVLEAARAGCCLVLSDISSLRELWDGAAIFVDPREPSKWAESFRRLSSDPNELARWGEAALNHSRQYSEVRSRESYAKVYSSLLACGLKREEAAA